MTFNEPTVAWIGYVDWCYETTVELSVDDMLLTLFPGERATISVFTEAELSSDDLTSPVVLRHANQLVTAARSADVDS